MITDKKYLKKVKSYVNVILTINDNFDVKKCALVYLTIFLSNR